MSKDREEVNLVARLVASGLTTPPALADYIERYGGPVISMLSYAAGIVGPFYMKLGRAGYSIYKKLPVDLFTALTGLGLCFCGGSYCASIAAIEAFRMCGWEQTKAALMDVADDFSAIAAANEVDNKKDDDGNGIADVDECTPQELLNRKLSLFAIAVKDPNKLSTALGGLYTAWLAVQGTLRLEFARTITLGVSSEFSGA